MKEREKGKSQMADLEKVTEVLLGFYKERERERPRPNVDWLALLFHFCLFCHLMFLEV